MKRAIFILLILALVVITAALGASLLNTWFPLSDSLAHFRAHYIALLSAIGVGFLLLQSWRSLGLTIAVAAIGALSIYPAWPFLSPHDALTKPLKLIQFNTLFNNPTPERSLEWIKAQAPDFVMMQEVSSKTMAIYDGLAEDLPYGAFCKFARVHGVAVRSKFPVIDQSCVQGKGLVWVRADVNGRQISLASIHLLWPYPFKQWQQIASLESVFKSIPRPLILTGDFNAAPWSEAVSRVAVATDTKVVPGFRLTLPMGEGLIAPVPVLPIDHVLLPEGTAVGETWVGPSIGSDHLPVVTLFEVKSDQ
jgi:endonuclease/exonuclease/phosphatase (EEP) superfamily protein YafD